MRLFFFISLFIFISCENNKAQVEEKKEKKVSVPQWKRVRITGDKSILVYTWDKSKGDIVQFCMKSMDEWAEEKTSSGVFILLGKLNDHIYTFQASNTRSTEIYNLYPGLYSLEIGIYDSLGKAADSIIVDEDDEIKSIVNAKVKSILSKRVIEIIAPVKNKIDSNWDDVKIESTDNSTHVIEFIYLYSKKFNTTYGWSLNHFGKFECVTEKDNTVHLLDE